MSKWYLVSFLLATVPFYAYSAQSYFCPDTRQYVSTGFDMETVKQKCGAPTSTEKRNEEVSESIPMTQWFYGGGAGQNRGTRAQPPITFSIQEGIVKEIRVDGQSVEGVSLCGTSNQVKVGDDPSIIQSSCGYPTYKQDVTLKQAQGKKEVIVWTYENQNYLPKASFEFENGILTKITTGN